jgi:putative NADPH-quinone reductase
MKVLVVYCHPVPESFCAALRDAAVETLRGAGHDLRLIDLYAENFNPVMCCDERRGYNDRPPDDPSLEPHIEAIRWAEAILFVYPTWWYGLPAMLKGWLDRVWATDVAFSLSADGGIVPRMTHIRKLGIVTTCGAPWWLSQLIGHPGRKTILRGIRALCGTRCRTLFMAHYRMDASTPQSRAAYLGKVKKRLARF